MKGKTQFRSLTDKSIPEQCKGPHEDAEGNWQNKRLKQLLDIMLKEKEDATAPKPPKTLDYSL